MYTFIFSFPLLKTPAEEDGDAKEDEEVIRKNIERKILLKIKNKLKIVYFQHSDKASRIAS